MKENRKFNRKSLIVIIACVLAVGAVFFHTRFAPSKGQPGGMSPQGMGPQGNGPKGAGAKGMNPQGMGAKGKGSMGKAETVVSVRTRIAEVKTLHDFVNTNGEIESKSSIAVFPDIGGKVYKNFVGLGSVVKKGEAISEIDPSEPGSYYTHSKVFAPVSGTIIASPVEPGTKVSTQSVITTIGDVSNLQLRVKIVERYVANIRNGLKAKVRLEAFGDEVFDATVTKVSPVLDQTSRTKEVILDFDRKDERINAGMFGKVTLYTVDYKDMVTVPASCIVTKGKHNYVFVIDGDVAKKIEVNLGHSVENEVQVDGIENGQRIVVEGMNALTDGSKIRDLTND